jgi:hypothetical protein
MYTHSPEYARSVPAFKRDIKSREHLDSCKLCIAYETSSKRLPPDLSARDTVGNSLATGCTCCIGQDEARLYPICSASLLQCPTADLREDQVTSVM